MNNRLYEIINEAFIGTTDGKLSEANTTYNVERFADLLINECAFVIQDFVDHRFPASEYPERLRRYFNVKNEQ